MYLMKRIPLAKLRYKNPVTVATLPGMKAIIRVDSARLVKWYLMIPAIGDGDAMCFLIQQAPLWELIHVVEAQLIAEETARYA